MRQPKVSNAQRHHKQVRLSPVHTVDLFELFHNVILNFDRAKEITMAFFSDTRDPKIPHLNASVFGRPRGRRRGEPLQVDEHSVLEPALTLPPPVVEGMGAPDLYAQ